MKKEESWINTWKIRYESKPHLNHFGSLNLQFQQIKDNLKQNIKEYKKIELPQKLNKDQWIKLFLEKF